QEAELRAEDRQQKEQQALAEHAAAAVVGDALARQAEPEQERAQAEQQQRAQDRRQAQQELRLAAGLRQEPRLLLVDHVPLAGEHLPLADLRVDLARRADR